MSVLALLVIQEFKKLRQENTEFRTYLQSEFKVSMENKVRPVTSY